MCKIVAMLLQVLTIHELIEYWGYPSPTVDGYQYEAGFIVLEWLIAGLVLAVIAIGFVLALYHADWNISEVKVLLYSDWSVCC